MEPIDNDLSGEDSMKRKRSSSSSEEGSRRSSGQINLLNNAAQLLQQHQASQQQQPLDASTRIGSHDTRSGISQELSHWRSSFPDQLFSSFSNQLGEFEASQGESQFSALNPDTEVPSAEPNASGTTNDSAGHANLSAGVARGDTISDFDVLFGRGKAHRKHPANVRMQLLADYYRERYIEADRDQKTRITKGIVHVLKSGSDERPGRFLKMDHDSNKWVEVSDEIARAKVGHSIRDGRTMTLAHVEPSILEDLRLLPDSIRQSIRSAGEKASAEEATTIVDLFAASMPSPPDANDDDESSAKPVAKKTPR